MPTLQIGRAGSAYGSLDMNSPATWTYHGDSLSAAGQFSATLADALAIRQQLRGLIDNPDEPIVPIISSSDAAINGFYEITSADVDTVGPSLGSGSFGYKVTARRVAGYSAPLLETITSGATRGNDFSLTVPAWVSLPPGVAEVSDTGTDDFSRQGEDGFLTVLKPNGGYAADITYQADPTTYYQNAAKLLMTSDVIQFDGTASPTVRAMVGRQAPAYTGWQLSNGLVRAWNGSSTFYAQWYKPGSGWRPTPTALKFTASIGIVGLNINGVVPTVLHNTPELVVLRFAAKGSVKTRGGGAVGASAVIDLGLRRGSRVFEVTITSTDAAASITVDAGAGGTTFTGGVAATAADSDGAKAIIVTNRTFTSSGRIDATRSTIAAKTPVSFGFGFQMSLSGDEATTTNLRDQWLAAVSEKVLVVAR